MVLIDMEMPKSCCECRFCDNDAFCVVNGLDLFGYIDVVYNHRFLPDDWKCQDCPLKPFTPPEPQITTNIYDTEEIHHNCTVQILRNSMTGEVSVGWWEEKEEKE